MIVTKEICDHHKIILWLFTYKMFCYSYKIILWAPFCDRHKRNLWPSQNYFVIIYLQNILLQLQNYFVSGVLWLSQKHFVTVTKCVCNSHKTYFVTFTKAFCNYNKMLFVMMTIFFVITLQQHIRSLYLYGTRRPASADRTARAANFRRDLEAT